MIRTFVLSITCLVVLVSITNVAAEEEFSPLKDKNIEEWHKIGASLISNGKYEESIKYYDKILEINPNDANALLNKGSVLIELNKFDEAIELLKNTKGTVFDEDWRLSVALSNVYSLMDEKELAIEWIQKAIGTVKPWIISSFHPAFLMRQPEQKKLAWIDLKMVRDKMKNLKI